MKKLGIMAAINEVKENQIKIKIKCRHISPPPYMNGGDNEITQTQQSNQETVPDFDFDNASRQML